MKCPFCGRIKCTVRYGDNPHAWMCLTCSKIFEDVDDGTTTYSRPDIAAEKKEQYEIRQAKRRLKQIRRR